MNFDIDYVFPYVNNTDEVWKRTFIDYCKKIDRTDKIDSINGQRYNDMGLLPSLVKCIKINMPWIRKIYIIVSNIEQLPKAIRDDEKVHVVLHKDIIPQRYLPTFNSTTIEMFIPKIDGLAEHFIYGNDDMFPVDKLNYTDFFNEDGTKIRINWHKEKLKLLPQQFRKVCYNNNKILIDSFGFNPQLGEKEFFRPLHGVTPMLRSHCEVVMSKCGERISKNIKAFRSDKQCNQYIFPLYEKFTDNVENTSLKLKYLSNSNSLDDICFAIEDARNDIICINDTGGDYRQENIKYKAYIIRSFEKRLSNN